MLVRFEARDSAWVVVVSGELTSATEREFADRVAQPLSALPGPVLFDLSGLDFMDCYGARVLTRVLRTAPATVRLVGCRPSVRRVLDTVEPGPVLVSLVPASVSLLPVSPVPASLVPASLVPASLVPAFPVPASVSAGLAPSRGAALTALAQATRSNSRRSAERASEVMSRLAVTYTELALSSRYRAPGQSASRGRLLALSGQARELSEQYRRVSGSVA